jgi:hypothetical protein
MPDTCVYLQTAQDIEYDAAAPEKFIQGRQELDAKRIAAVQQYLTAYTAGRHLDWQIAVHDPAEVGMSAVPMGISILRRNAAAAGTLGAAGVAGMQGGAPNVGSGAIAISGGAGGGGAIVGGPGGIGGYGNATGGRP